MLGTTSPGAIDDKCEPRGPRHGTLYGCVFAVKNFVPTRLRLSVANKVKYWAEKRTLKMFQRRFCYPLCNCSRSLNLRRRFCHNDRFFDPFSFPRLIYLIGKTKLRAIETPEWARKLLKKITSKSTRMAFNLFEFVSIRYREALAQVFSLWQWHIGDMRWVKIFTLYLSVGKGPQDLRVYSRLSC